MIKIRLAKIGSKNRPFYRIVAIDNKKKVTGKYLAVLGFYNPLTKESKFNSEKYKAWVSKGAQVSKRVKKIVENK